MSAVFVRGMLVSIVVLVTLTGCRTPSARTADDARPSAAIVDTSYLTSDQWNDGRAEVAFYRVRRTHDPYGRANEKRFVAGTYLVKHRYDPAEMTKTSDGTGTSSFKYAFFYELESGSYQYKRNWVTNARQKDLRPFKQSFTSFDWCSNQYREVAFPLNGPVEYRMRSDDYGNERTSFGGRERSYPPSQLPLLVRGLDFSASDTLSFSVAVADETTHVSAQAVFTGTDSVETEAGAFDAERIAVTYDTPAPSLIGEESASTEVYWRGTGPQRLLLRMEAASGRYQMSLVEHLRTAYWEENLWPRLQRVAERP